MLKMTTSHPSIGASSTHSTYILTYQDKWVRIRTARSRYRLRNHEEIVYFNHTQPIDFVIKKK